MHLFDYTDGGYLLCSSFEAEFQTDPETDSYYYNTQVFKLKPTRQQAEMFYNFFIPATDFVTGTLLSGRYEETAFDGEFF